ncbi:MAG: hypothetical protein HY962_02265 [Ignavibacteriae bacterium]|nr:hypothetical protein [Ignavibacteriota bacterium]
MLVLRLILAIVLGLVLGSIVNMALVMLGGVVVPPPPGADMNTPEGIRAALPLLGPGHYIFPLLAHALGTLAGAFIAARVTEQRKLLGAMIVGAFFFIGGILAATMIPAPAWFVVLDLAIAYFPCAWLGYRFARPRP